MKTFNDLEFKEPFCGGEISRVYFDNGYGVSVVRSQYSYGGKEGLYELAVVSEETGEITYDTPITDDVIGYLTPEGVTTLMLEIQQL
jgi:hypothetical protein